MHIIYETNGLGFLGWITDLPGAYIRGKTLEEARGKVNKEIALCTEWLNFEKAIDMQINEEIKKSDLHIEDADSDIIFDSELIDFDKKEEFLFWCNKILLSGTKTEEIYKRMKNKSLIDITMKRKTFYGDVYCTINDQYRHIVNVQNYYLNQIGTEMNIADELRLNRMEFIEKLKEKYLKEGNKLYRNESEDWTVKKVIRRTIWHDRIHIRAIERMENRLSG
ncbi:hypothetical protein [Treponema denticola]|jgi:hypothetical protein|uniref:hypothetical protein n=1 Tax=Treponema denticola TaxID=158 RepID=UPI0020A3B3B2|nr:hypothetical protein [Treponema denticola]UTC84474.1 hypothetical protein E4N91_01970 [Treponema denticola]